MKKTLLFVLILSGLSTLSTKITRKYHYIKILKTWAEAQSYCRETFTDLATVENQDDHDRLQRILQGDGEYAWIGLYDYLTRWKWTLGNADFNNDTDFSNWVPHQTVPNPNNKICTAMTADGLWYVTASGAKHPAVCYYGLASVRNNLENNNISSLLSETSWIGLFKAKWARWSDQSRSVFSNWNEGQPKINWDTMESCAALNTTTGTWWDVDCNSKHYFICEEFKIRHKKTFKLKFQSEADLNDPAVQQQILEQLHAKLEKHGLPDFKLRWVETDGQTFHKQKQEEEEGSSG
ncbi:uncharacterized protein LOC127357933 [Dicentrarchus labrax]|uniref:uncharacterized protein LOC127357933 n=1 Tax=Dicentrarchus labrax TaxID=13489 RepID=UPI0021F66C13|nr:uncharacterized protein LOC127357933 [Dicentrarchus labrax]